jgi:hypothetical protein
VATLTRTHTKTYALLTAWASTLPHECADRTGHVHVHAGDACAVPRCGEPMPASETVYAVTEVGESDAPEAIPCRTNPAITTADCHHAEQWVCWRHVRPDDGPITVPSS